MLAPGQGTASWSSVLTSRENFQTLCSIFRALGREAEVGSTEGSQCQTRATIGAKVAVIGGTQEEPTSVAVLLGNFDLFTVLKDYSPFHQRFFEMTGSAIH